MDRPGTAGAAGHALDSRVPLTHPAVARALEAITAAEPRTIERQIALCEIPAPPFEEAARGEDYRRRFVAAGLEEVRIDGAGNVLGVRRGSGDGPRVVISAHLDTVFPAETDVSVSRDGSILRGPGICDDCRGLAVVLAVLDAMNAAEVHTRGDVIFAGTVGEEGEGNLRGVRHLFDQTLEARPDCFISVDGSGIQMITGGVGSNRYRVRFHGPGGHSYADFGMPNPIHALGRAIDGISRMEVPKEPRTTYSVGRVEGGTSVNAIAREAVMMVDLRSSDPAALNALDERFRRILREALEAERTRWERAAPLDVELKEVGRRPAGTQPPDAEILRSVRGAGKALGLTPSESVSSTDANYPMSLGVPSVTIGGGGHSEGAHSPDEWFDTTDSHLGSRWVLLSLLTLAGVR